MNANQTFPRFGSSHSSDANKPTADGLASGWETRSIQEALDEVSRELGVRERVYPKWVVESKHTVSDAMDRFQRLIKAASVLSAIVNDPGLLGVIEQHLCQPAPTDANKPKF